ncbi:MAG: type II toxin-antitoxin system RelE/ParE family toxin [Pirellulales bacterium]
MTYEVVIQPRALRDLQESQRWAAKHAPMTARRWFNRFIDRLHTLNKNPQRCGFAEEARKSKREIRQLLFGKRPNVYRALFVVDARQVCVFRVIRAQRRALTRRQIDEDIDPESET